MIDKTQYIFGLRPVIEAIEAGKEIEKLLVKKDMTSDLSKELIDCARAHGVLVQRVPVERLNRITRRNHQGVVAILSAVTYYRLDNLIPSLYEQGTNPFVVVLDGVTDVRNFGAIARTCECAEVSAVVIPERNSVGATADAVKTSAGALNYLPVCRERNLVDAVRLLRDSGFKVVGTASNNSVNYTKCDYTGPVALVMGSEDTGISAEVLRLCDTCVVIPEFGQINSLNVSVASGIMIYEVVRQRLNDNQIVE